MTCRGPKQCKYDIHCCTEHCEECVGRRCEYKCDPLCQVCNGCGGCVDKCNIYDCLTCDGSGNCVSTCDILNCEVCDGNGNCVSACDPTTCEVCDGLGNCNDDCVPPETCDGGVCVAPPVTPVASVTTDNSDINNGSASVTMSVSKDNDGTAEVIDPADTVRLTIPECNVDVILPVSGDICTNFSGDTGGNWADLVIDLDCPLAVTPAIWLAGITATLDKRTWADRVGKNTTATCTDLTWNVELTCSITSATDSDSAAMDQGIERGPYCATQIDIQAGSKSVIFQMDDGNQITFTATGPGTFVTTFQENPFMQLGQSASDPDCSRVIKATLGGAGNTTVSMTMTQNVNGLAYEMNDLDNSSLNGSENISNVLPLTNNWTYDEKGTPGTPNTDGNGNFLNTVHTAGTTGSDGACLMVCYDLGESSTSYDFDYNNTGPTLRINIGDLLKGTCW